MKRDVAVLGAPTDYGTHRRGVDMGPSAIRYGGLAEQVAQAGVEVRDCGDLAVTRAEQRGEHDERAHFLPEVRDVCTRLAGEVESVLDAGEFPLVLGGDHSIAVGTLAAAARERSLGAVWFDAHADFNTPEISPSGNVHGMSLAAALGRGSFASDGWARAAGLDADNVVWVGLRDLDPAEREAVRESGATAYTMSDIDERGIADVTEAALDRATDGTDAVHLSLDLDFLDPTEAPGVGTPVRGGATYREAHTALELVADHLDPLSMDLVEVNPTLDSRNETAELACELAASALGKRVL
jgi:arginase